MISAAPPRGWGYPAGRPFLLLSVYFAVAGVQVAVVAARPPLPGTHVTALWMIAAASAVLLLTTLLAWTRWATRALGVLVLLGVLQSGASAAVAVGGQGQLVAGFYLAVLGLYSGYFLSAGFARVFAIVATVVFGAALMANPRLDSPAYVLAVVVMVDGLTLIVSSLVRALQVEAVHDPLTGALNRRGLEESATLVHDIDARRSRTTALVEIDLDGFKHFNDTRGHQAGDHLLAELVHDWSGVLRSTDLLARTGGDEFVLILPATGQADAEALLDRLHAANDAAWSAGIVVWEQGDALPIALGRADEEMYRHKPTPPWR